MPLIATILMILAVLAVSGLIAAMALLKGAVRKRDRVRSPEERTYGAGERAALLLYQPSNHGGNVPLTQALAEQVAALGYTVTVNYPSEQLPYNPEDYDLLIFGTNVYMGEVAEPVKKYLSAHPFADKRVLLYVTGKLAERPELDALAALVPPGNEVAGVKLRAQEPEKLLDFARGFLQE